MHCHRQLQVACAQSLVGKCGTICAALTSWLLEHQLIAGSQAAGHHGHHGQELQQRQEPAPVSAVQTRLRQFSKHETRHRQGACLCIGWWQEQERGRDGGVGGGFASWPNKHFRKLHAFVKTKQCAKCLFVLVSAFERKNDSTQKLQLEGSPDKYSQQPAPPTPAVCVCVCVGKM